MAADEGWEERSGIFYVISLHNKTRKSLRKLVALQADIL